MTCHNRLVYDNMYDMLIHVTDLSSVREGNGQSGWTGGQGHGPELDLPLPNEGIGELIGGVHVEGEGP